MTLSFDALYTCFFPWESIVQVVFQPILPTIDQDNDIEEEQKSNEVGSLGQDKNTDEKADALEESVAESVSPFAVISNDSFEEDEQEDEQVDSVSKKPISISARA